MRIRTMGFWSAGFRVILVAICTTVLPATGLADYDDGLRAFERGDYAVALREFQVAGDAGHVGALYYLGRMRLMAEGGPADYKQAVKYLRQAAEGGNANAQFYLGVLYYRGIAVKRDYDTAVKWYTAAAEQGDHVSRYTLGVMYAAGAGVTRDRVRALALFIRATEAGNKLAPKFQKLIKAVMSPEEISAAEQQAKEKSPAAGR